MRIAQGVAAVSAVAFAVPGSASAVPVGGAYYVGTAPGVTQPSFVKVSADGRTVAAYFFDLRLSCSDGRSRTFLWNHIRERRFGLIPDGRFDYAIKPRRLGLGKGRRRIAGTGSFRSSGNFGPDEATLVMRARFAGKTSCNGDFPLTLRRVGSPALPASDQTMTTGRYPTARESGVTVPAFRTIGPARLVTGLRVDWSVNCEDGRSTYRDSWPFGNLIVSPKGTLDLKVADRYRVGGGLIARTRARLTLRFKRDGFSAMFGSWRAHTRLYRGKRRVATCIARRSIFSSHAPR